MRIVCCKYFGVLLLVTAAVPSCLWAQEAALRAGMNYAEVISLKGPAGFKLEEESRRRDVWSYSDDKLVFHNGRLQGGGVDSPRILSNPGSSASSSRRVFTEAQKRNVPLRFGRAPAKGLLIDLLRDVPSDESPKESGPSAAGVPPMIGGPRGVLPLEGRERR